MFESHFYELAILCVRSINLQVFKSWDSIVKDVVVYDSAFGSTLPGIHNLSIACICYDIGVSAFLNVGIVILRESDASKVTLRELLKLPVEYIPHSSALKSISSDL